MKPWLENSFLLEWKPASGLRWGGSKLLLTAMGLLFINCSQRVKKHVEALPKKKLLWMGLGGVMLRGSEEAQRSHTTGIQIPVAKCPCVGHRGECATSHFQCQHISLSFLICEAGVGLQDGWPCSGGGPLLCPKGPQEGN